MQIKREFVITGHNGNIVRIWTFPDGGAEIRESTLVDKDEQAEFALSRAEAIARDLFDGNLSTVLENAGVIESFERLSEDAANELGKAIAEHHTTDPWKVACDTIESFLLNLALEGIDLNNPAVSRALASTTESLANNLPE